MPVTLNAELRQPATQGGLNQMRKGGRVPAIVYGHGREAVAVSVDLKEFREVLHTGQGANVLLDLQVAGLEQDKAFAAMIKTIQREPIKHVPLHIDFQWVSLQEQVTVRVPVHVTGVAPGLELGGALEQILYEVEVECRPGDIPDALMVDLTGMEIHDTRHVSDLVAPAGVVILADPGEAVLTIAAPIREEDLQVQTGEVAVEEAGAETTESDEE